MNAVLLPYRTGVSTEVVVRVGFAVGIQGRVRVQAEADDGVGIGQSFGQQEECGAELKALTELTIRNCP
jgi:hypothetical protein